MWESLNKVLESIYFYILLQLVVSSSAVNSYLSAQV